MYYVPTTERSTAMTYKSTFEALDVFNSSDGTTYREYEARGQALWGSVDLIEWGRNKDDRSGNHDLKAILVANDHGSIYARSVRPGWEGVEISLRDDAAGCQELSLKVTDEQARVLRDQLNALEI